MVSDEAIIKAVLTDILPDGTGRFLVLSIKMSRSFSITWLNALDAPTIQYPPKTNKKNVFQLKGLSALKPNKYPAIEENNTLTANPAFVISLKSVKIDLIEKIFKVAFNAFGL